MLLIEGLDSILAFVVPEVFSHQGPPAPLNKDSDFHFLSNLPAWRCGVMGFGAPMVEWLQVYTAERMGSTVLASYMWFSTPKEPPQVFHANPA